MNKKSLQKKIGANIKKCREAKGIYQQILASMCDFEKSNMSRLEAGNTNPTIYTLYKISLALEIELVDLLELS